MAIEGLTQQQSNFIERFLKVPKVFNRKAKKQARREATEQFRLINAEHDLLRDEIASLDDPELRSVFMAQLRATDAIIESDPKALNFEGGQQHIDDVRAALLVHIKKADATKAHAQIEKTMARMDADNPPVAKDGAFDGQSDIALTWAFAQEKLASGKGTNNTKDLDAALKAMGRLQAMLQSAERAGQNPFEQRVEAMAGVREAAQKGLSPEVQGARRRLSDVHTQLDALRQKLAAQFGGENVPLALRMSCQSVQSKLDEAVKAETSELSDLADDAEAAYQVVNRDSLKLITQAQEWVKDNGAFQVRYHVMLAHPYAKNKYVKPKFDEITTAFTAAADKAKTHEYTQASQQIAVVRNDLKDTLDFADDFANYATVFNARKALLATLPAPSAYAVPALRADHTVANQLLLRAEAARKAGQMSGALTLLNSIPKAVDDLIEVNRFASNYKEMKKNWEDWHAHVLSNVPGPAQVLLKTDLEYAVKTAAQANDDAAAGNYRKASAALRALCAFAKQSLFDKGQLIAQYQTEKSEFKARARTVRATKGPEGRIAIEGYYQGLVGDDIKRKAAEASGDFKLALAMCLRGKAEHDAMIRLAGQAKAYIAQDAKFGAALAKLKTATSPDAMEAKQNANDMKSNAFAATERGNWLAGTNLLENANLELKRALDDFETASLIDGAQGGGGKIALTSDTEFGSVYAGFAKVLAHVQSLDKYDVFTDELKAAEASAKSAEALMAKDLSRAENTLNDAVARCQRIAKICTESIGYSAQKTSAKTVIDQARNENAQNIIDAEVKEAEDSFAAAEKAAQAPAYDYAGAIKLLGIAQAAARKGLAAMQLFNGTIDDARTKMTTAINAYTAPDVTPHLDGQAARLRTVLNEMNADFDQRKFTDAQAKAAKGVELAGFHTTTCADCKKAVGVMLNFTPARLGVEVGHATTTQEEAMKTDLLAAAQEAINKGSFGAAYKIASQAYWVMMGARKKAESFDRYLPVKIDYEQKLDDLEARSVPAAGAGHDEVLALRARFDAAEVQAKLENYGGALKRLDGFDKELADATVLLDLYDRYVLRQKQAATALETVRKMKSPAIETLLTRLEGKERNAERKGQGFDFDIAIALFEELKADCDNAKDTADAVDELAAMTSDIKDLPTENAEGLLAAIAKTRQTLDGLKGQVSAMYAHGEILESEARLKAAETLAPDDFDAARVEVEAVVDACTEITILLAQYDQLNDSAAVARGLAEKLLKRGAEADFARDEINARLAALDLAMSAARLSKSNRAQTQIDVEEAIAALRDLRKVIDAQADYLKNREPVEFAMTTLEKSKQRHLIREDMTVVRKLLDTAATRAADRKHSSAQSELKKAVIRVDMAKLRAKLATNRKPKPEDLAAILDAPGGIENLDSIVENLEASVQRRVMAVAFEARFGCKLDLKEADTAGTITDVDRDGQKLPAANIRRFYDVMSKLPESNTLDNDSMLTFEQVGGKGLGSAYNTQEKRVMMRDGDEAESRVYGISIEHEIGEIDEDAIPKPGQARTGFSWNTLHEVGHAVDDKLGYMKKHGERLAGWKVYGANVKEPATAIADQFKFDADYVAEYMMGAAGRKMPVPDPVGCDGEEWRRRMEECRNFVDRAREGNKPWLSASVAAACAIGNYTYVESYEGDWARYSTDQRKYAVSGYQFRAPGEWFSEIYAAVASDRLNDNHPHRDEIAKLCLKEDA
ncbi:hypothetical protein [Sulfitobacter geojensis]|uniref:Uncharacterized protein n=1 Tax=Sulfitobacter geojensis TaxID=1342299 RepID=A0AAE3B783_9RHOB|nr:hypothetical protein [Sulfitobacter geojensis]MBM1689870.1 hypothetical protein [Sulfitobacter geojensis]MBM1693936.1 hypothetical protein [Sulfitobacter geojensis]MBM1706102.1 hypothetical protein [Sulfitobacter geojensis]MBM1710160.1 hypothetical protein [Sulfitobacter geojensis]MBM1714226.1 hypothetical protein [Sulfitobacter geojensis]